MFTVTESERKRERERETFFPYCGNDQRRHESWKKIDQTEKSAELTLVLFLRQLGHFFSSLFFLSFFLSLPLFIYLSLLRLIALEPFKTLSSYRTLRHDSFASTPEIHPSFPRKKGKTFFILFLFPQKYICRA